MNDNSINISREKKLRKVFQFFDGKLTEITMQEVKSGMIICLCEPEGTPVTYKNNVFFIVRKTFVTEDGTMGFEFNT